MIVFVGIVAVGTYDVLSIAPVYKSEVTVLIETGDTKLTQTTQANPGDPRRSTSRRSPARCS